MVDSSPQLFCCHVRNFWWSSDAQQRKISWIAWQKVTKAKQMGGLGFRDYQDFNVALLAKQAWRIMKYPHSFLAQVYKSKYFRKKNFLQAEAHQNSSYAWKGLMKTQQMIGKGIRWFVGNGQKINVWADPWLPTTPSRPAMGMGKESHPNLNVVELINQVTKTWDITKLMSLINEEDVDLIMRIRPSLTNAKDKLIWTCSRTGEYTVRSGYHLQHEQVINQRPQENTGGALC